jgi:hypothetical protein
MLLRLLISRPHPHMRCSGWVLGRVGVLRSKNVLVSTWAPHSPLASSLIHAALHQLSYPHSYSQSFHHLNDPYDSNNKAKAKADIHLLDPLIAENAKNKQKTRSQNPSPYPHSLESEISSSNRIDGPAWSGSSHFTSRNQKAFYRAYSPIISLGRFYLTTTGLYFMAGMGCRRM